MARMLIDDARALMEDFLWGDAEPRQRDKRERILRAATGLFERHGYRKTSVDDVARQAAIAKGTVYLYYRNKAELLFHAAALEKITYLERLQPVFDGACPRQRLHDFIVVAVTVFPEMPLMSRITRGDHEIGVILEEIDDGTLQDVNRRQDEIAVRLVDEATDRALSRDVLQARTEVLIDLVYSVLASGRTLRQSLSLEQYAHVLADMVVNGVLAPAGVVDAIPAETPLRRAE